MEAQCANEKDNYLMLPRVWALIWESLGITMQI